MFCRLVLSTFASLTLAGCTIETFSYGMNQYGEVRGVRVRLGCRDTYEVFDRRDRRTLVVVTNPVNEALAGSCPDATALPLAERMRSVAEAYLVDTTNRPECVLGRQTPLTEFHSEFEYRCPVPRRAR